jgi:Secretion system C-terminal sorting domain
MKNILILITAVLTLSALKAQDVRFYQQTVNDGTTQTSKVSIYAYSVGALNNMRGFDLQFFFDGTKATFASINSDALTGPSGLNFGTAGESYLTLSQNNPNVPITHNTLFTYLINDLTSPQTGADLPAFPGVLLMEINFSSVVGPAPNFGYLSSSTQSPGIVYTNVDIDEFDIVVTGAQAQSLPLELTSISAAPLEKTIQVDWTSKSEINFSHFELERSTDARNFQFLTKVSGEGQSHNEYAYTDGAVIAGINYYYRLKMMDQDGGFAYSAVVQAKLEGRQLSIVQVAPNPTMSLTNITFDLPTDEDVTIRVMDLTGRLVFTQSYLALSGSNVLTLDLSTYASGTYSLELSTANHRATHKIVKAD